MKRSLTLLLTLAVGLWITSLSAAAQGRGSHPASGLDHAEMTASNQGQRGIEKAETKQAVHKHAKKAKGKKAGKKLAKGQSKAKRH
jgi:hypothetical protein